MTLFTFDVSNVWDRPIYKFLAKNDTGSAPGHQAGVLIPQELRSYFPMLTGTTSDVQPTVDVRLEADLYVEEKHVGKVNTRYQYQTWSGTRSPEARVTDELGAMRNLAEENDILIFQRAVNNAYQFRITLVRKGSETYKMIVSRINGRRWGALPQ